MSFGRSDKSNLANSIIGRNDIDLGRGKQSPGKIHQVTVRPMPNGGHSIDVHHRNGRIGTQNVASLDEVHNFLDHIFEANPFGEGSEDGT